MGGRLDWKHSRFDVRVETDAIEEGMRAFMAGTVHESIDYWKFWMAQTNANDIYNEGPTGRTFHPVVNVPCWHVKHIRGGVDQNSESGNYYNDRLLVTTSYQAFYRTGMTEADIFRQEFLKDFIYYDRTLFAIDQIDVEGQVSRYGGRTIVSIEATQVKPDEMAYDQIFANYANQGSPAPWET